MYGSNKKCVEKCEKKHSRAIDLLDSVMEYTSKKSVIYVLAATQGAREESEGEGDRLERQTGSKRSE